MSGNMFPVSISSPNPATQLPLHLAAFQLTYLPFPESNMFIPTRGPLYILLLLLETPFLPLFLTNADLYFTEKMQMNVYAKQKQTHRHRKQSYGYQKGRGERNKLGVWN